MTYSPPVQELTNVLVLTRHHRMKGKWRGDAASERMGAALNDEKGVLSLGPVAVEDLDGSRPSIMPTIAVDKSQITAVVLKGIAVHQNDIDRTPAAASSGRVVVVLSVPPFMAQGEIHWRYAREIQRLGEGQASRERLRSLTRFFELTEGCLFLSFDPIATHSLVLLNRDHVTEVNVLGGDSASAGGLSNLFSNQR